MYTVLLTDGEFTGMIRALRDYAEIRIVGFVFSEYAAHRTLLDASYIAPEWDDPGYIPFLEDVIRKEKVDLVFPVVTKSLEYMASMADEIKSRTGAIVVTSPKELIHIVNNKDLLLDHLASEEDLADAIPSHLVARNIGELIAAIRDFEKQGIDCIMKPVCGENRDGFLKVVTDEEYASAFAKGDASLLTTISILETMGEKLDFNVPMLVMPYLPGQEWDVDILAKNGKILSCTIRKNLGMIGGLSACTETSDNPVIYSICEKILRALPLSNIFCLSFKEDADGKPKLLEINPRAMGSIYVSTLAGNSLVSAFFRHFENPETFNENPEITPSGKVVSLFFDVVKMTEANLPSNNSASDETITWRPLTTDSRKEYLHYYNMNDTKITDLTFHCRYAWDRVFAIEYTILEDCLVQISGGGGYTSPFMLMPLGKLNPSKLQSIIEKVRPVFEARNWPFRICSIDESAKDIFLTLPFSYRICTAKRDSSDYLYDAESLRHFTGKKYAKKRNHLKHFLEKYPDYEYLDLEPSLFPACLELVRDWAKKKEVDVYDISESDYLMIERVFRKWDQLDMRGGAIRIGEKIVGFSIGSIGHPDTAFIHFEKADTDYDGLPVALCKHVISSAFAEVKYVNREEDLGIPGLRQSKESYHPIALIEKYKIEY
ncbi:MAG: ATP-grasp domain-containing protein [Clostridiales bacterium]|nr:ATP-grasp domain-containing protein [Clostridiales bacterium]